MAEAKSSGHFAVGGSGYFYHNDRSHKTKNSIFSDEKNDVSCSANEAMKMYRQELQKRSEAYTARTNQKLQKNIATHRSLIINLHQHHTLDDLEEVKKYLEKSLDTKVLQIAIHRDEGYIDKETGEHHKNYHAHIEMMGIDSHGISIAQHQNKNKSKKQVEATREKRLDKKFYSDFQTFLADSLKMERGKHNSKAVRLDTYDWKREAEIRSDLVTEATKEIKAKIKDVKAQFNQEKQALVDSGTATKEQHAILKAKYKELEALAKDKGLNLEQLKKLKGNKAIMEEIIEDFTKTALYKPDDYKVTTAAEVKEAQEVAKAQAKELEELRVLKRQNRKEIEKLREQVQELESDNYSLKEKLRELEKELNNNRADNQISTEKSYQHKLFFVEYKALVITDLTGFFIDTKGMDTKLFNTKKDIKVIDKGDKILALGKNMQEQVKLILDIAQAKGWNLSNLNIRGDEYFISEVKRQISERIFRQMRDEQIESEEPTLTPEPEPNKLNDADYLFQMFEEIMPETEPNDDRTFEEIMAELNYKQLNSYQDLTNTKAVSANSWMDAYRAMLHEINEKYGEDSPEHNLLMHDQDERWDIESELSKERYAQQNQQSNEQSNDFNM